MALKAAFYNLTTTTQFGGVESFVWETARGLARRGVEVTLVSGRGKLHRELPGVRVLEFPYVSRARLRRLPGLAKAYTLTKLVERLSLNAAAFGAVQRLGLDLLHLQKPYDLPASLLHKAWGGGKIVLGSHGTDFFPGDRWFARRVDASVACSEFNAGQVEARYGFRPQVIYNGIDPAVFRPVPVEPDLRRALAGEGVLVLYVGRLVRWKGLQHLIAAVARLRREREVTLALAGAGEYRPALEEQARALGLGESLRWLGFVPPEQLPRYYAAADLIALASYANETFGISVLEAMACARPAVGTRFGGIPEVIADGETGLLARPEDPDDLAAQMARLLDDAALREQMGQAGRRRALERFTWDHVVERVLRVYEATVAGS